MQLEIGWTDLRWRLAADRGVSRRRSDQHASVERVELNVALSHYCAGQIIFASCLVHVDLYACGLHGPYDHAAAKRVSPQV